MIQVTRTLEPVTVERLHKWLERHVRPALTPDVSNYAKGRQRCWLGVEPPLGPTQPFRKGLEIPEDRWHRLQELIDWQFDYCLVTYSGDVVPVGITPHRDASYADYEAYGLNVVGTCRFSYWEDRMGFGYTQKRSGIKYDDPPSHVVDLTPGQVTRFNCKNLHAAEPSPQRWGMNFWRAKPERS